MRCVQLFIILLTLSGLPGGADAQLFYSNNTDITVLSGTTITVKGGMTTDGTSSIDNSGTIELEGDWINDSDNNCFGTSQGIVRMTGGMQIIGGTSSTMFNDLLLQGTGDKTLHVNTFCGGGYPAPSGILNLNDRILKLNSYMLTVTNPSPGAISRTTGFVESETDPVAGYGIIEWLMGDVLNGENYVFPFGNSATSHYLPLTVGITSGTVSSNGKFSLSTYPTNTAASPNNRPLPAGLPVLTSTSGTENASNTLDRFWIFDVTGYPASMTADLTFTYRDSEWNTGNNLITESDLRAQRHDLISWTPPLGNINTISNTATVSNVVLFNEIWTLAGNVSPLPIELISFEATPIDNEAVLCEWVTVTEINNDFFTLERSRDGFQYHQIARLNGAGNSTNLLKYKYIDQYPQQGLSYYRLKQTDFDGTISVAGVVPVLIRNGMASGLVVYPNPSSGIYYVQAAGDGGSDESLVITDMTGRIVHRADDFMNAKPLELDLSFLANGIYNLTVIMNEIRESVRIVKN